MTQHPGKFEVPKKDEVLLLETEIAYLEKELKKAEAELNAFESQIRSQLHIQISRIRELTILYKTQKLAKKTSRLEQKKKGKNFKEQKKLIKENQETTDDPDFNKDDLLELKRLYREAIVHIHPDKFAYDAGVDQTERANDLTIQLIALYKNGNLDELNRFHEHILSGNAMNHIPYKSETVIDSQAMISFLKKKKENLMQSLIQAKESPSYSVLQTYESPLLFIDELRVQFDQRIIQMENRTRKG